MEDRRTNPDFRDACMALFQYANQVGGDPEKIRARAREIQAELGAVDHYDGGSSTAAPFSEDDASEDGEPEGWYADPRYDLQREEAAKL